MKIRVLIVSFLVMLTLSLAAPAVMAAQTSFSATGTVTRLSATVGSSAGVSGRYVVEERRVTGEFKSGSIIGPFVMAYKANVFLETQAGTLSGTLNAGSYQFSVWGKSEPLVWVEPYVAKMTVSGSWQSMNAPGEGTFKADIFFIPDAEGHISQILPNSSFLMSGQWKG